MLKIRIAVITDLIKYLGSRQIEEIARKTGFLKRRDGKLKPETFFKALTIGLWGSHEASLTQLTEKCEEIQKGLEITKQALHERLDTGSAFLKEMLGETMTYALMHKVKVSLGGVLDRFMNIYITDATYLVLPDKLEEYYPGCGGTSKSKAALKIQTIINLVTHSIKDIQTRAGKESDKCFAKDIIRILEKGDLVIQDLGYLSGDFLKGVIEQEAYFLSRVPLKVAFFRDLKTSQNYPLPVSEIFKENETRVDTWLYMGHDKKLRVPVRVVAQKLPPEVVNERLRKAYAKKKNRNLTKDQKTLLCWNIVITNAPEEMLPEGAVLELYRIRWQIEIVFKAWKSHLGLKNVAYGGKSQVECMLYGRLITITLLTTIYSCYYALMYKEQKRELSILKFFCRLRDKAKELADHINKGISGALEISSIISKAASKSLSEKRKRKTTLEAILEYNVEDNTINLGLSG